MSPKQLFSFRICEIFKNTYFEENLFLKRLLLKPVQVSPGLPFLIICTSSLNWYICFSFCTLIYCFVCWFSLHYCWYCYNRKQSSGGVLQKRCSYKFCKINKKTPALKDSLLMKLQICRVLLYRKRDSGTDVFLWILQNFA